MLVVAAILTVLSALSCLIWISRHAMIIAERRKGFVLTQQYQTKSASQPLISVVVAAKDEQDNIEKCVRSMLDQDYPNFEIIVANDRSTDQTAAIVERIAAEDNRVQLVNITHLPEGWGGKNNAMQTAIRQARGEWICMIDADCEQTSRKSLATAMAYALDQGSDMLSVLPVLEMRSFWENVVQPVCSGLMMIWFHPDKVNSPKHRNAYANGAFMLMKQSAYQSVGTHEAVRSCVNEDMHMAARVKQAGLNLRVVRNTGLYTVRMYTSLKQIFRGWSRIFFGTFVTFRRMAISLAVLLLVSMMPYLAAPVGWLMWAAGAEPQAWWLVCGVLGSVAIVLQLSVMYRFYGMVNARRDLAWTYLLGCTVAMFALLSALGKLRKGAKIVWRNTSYATASKPVN